MQTTAETIGRERIAQVVDTFYERVQRDPGLAMPFSVEAHGEGEGAEAVLFPEWFTVYYPYGRADLAFPILALRSILHHEQFGGDWVNVAIGRMAHYSLPRELAEHFLAHGTRYH